MLSLGVAEGSWGVCILPGDDEAPSATFLRTDMTGQRWLDILGTTADDSLGGSVIRPTDLDALDATLRIILPLIDKVVAEPVSAAVQGAAVVTVIPHGWLNLVPLWALPSFSNVAVSVAPSAALLLQSPHEATLADALVVIDPTQELPVSHAEYAALVRHGLGRRLSLRRLVGGEATTDTVSRATRGAGLFHFTGHAVGDASSVAESGLILSGDAPGTAQLWAAADLYGSGEFEACGLAVLSACESGRGGIRLDSVSDFSGLPAGLQAAGVNAVVATLWPVSDDASALFVDLLYESLAKERVADLPILVARAVRDLRTITGIEAGARLMSMREHVDDPRARLRLEAYAALGLVADPAATPFAGPATWAAFHHIGARFLHIPDVSR